MLGVRIESDLARNIKKDVIKEKDVRGAFDLVLNDYGPDKYLGSIHIEVPDTLTDKRFKTRRIVNLANLI